MWADSVIFKRLTGSMPTNQHGVLLRNMSKKTIPLRYLFQLGATLIVLFLLWWVDFSSYWAWQLEIPEVLLLGALALIAITGIINFALTYLRANHSLPPQPVNGLLIPNRPLYQGTVLIAVNLGGALLPLGYAVGLWVYLKINPLDIIMVTMITAVAAYLLSKPIHGFGIGLPILVVPFITSISCKMLLTEDLFASAYIAATFGVILGTDVLRIKDLKQIGSCFISIGGAGVFDGIVLSGIIASLITLII